MGFQGMRKSTVLPNAQSRPPRATPASSARRRRPQHREFPAGYSLAGCSPAEPASASPAAPVYVHRPVRHNQLRCPHFLSPSASISRLRNQHTACHSRAPSRQSSQTEHAGRGGRRSGGQQGGPEPADRRLPDLGGSFAHNHRDRRGREGGAQGGPCRAVATPHGTPVVPVQAAAPSNGTPRSPASSTQLLIQCCER